MTLSLSADAFVVKPWYGANPFYLLIVREDGYVRKIDLDEPGWMGPLKEEIDRPGEWHLVRKQNDVVTMSLRVEAGDQPYYAARHVGTATGSVSREVIAYGIGKKTSRIRKGTPHDNEDNLWVLPWGQLCGGTDIEYFALKGLRNGLR